ncbi:hypothetical protein KAR91_51500 [Candidatus Pacearchaeota archaeon]|nr:hypothetical protein [Candidatus Pacearchaeota archaeon]
MRACCCSLPPECCRNCYNNNHNRFYPDCPPVYGPIEPYEKPMDMDELAKKIADLMKGEQ